MMGHDQVTAFGFCLFDHFFGGIQAAEDPGTFPARITGDQPGIVVGLLQGKWCPGFQEGGNGSYFHNGKLQQSLKPEKVEKAY
jgi:hypothetical protein